MSKTGDGRFVQFCSGASASLQVASLPRFAKWSATIPGSSFNFWFGTCSRSPITRCYFIGRLWTTHSLAGSTTWKIQPNRKSRRARGGKASAITRSLSIKISTSADDGSSLLACRYSSLEFSPQTLLSWSSKATCTTAKIPLSKIVMILSISRHWRATRQSTLSQNWLSSA